MKTLKNDTRYIIKRVLIGVLIAIVLFNARKCGVYAETIELSNISASNRCSPVNLIYTYDIGGNSRWSCASTSFQVSRTLSYSNTTLYYDTYNIKNYANVGNSTYNLKYFILYDSTNDYYIIQNTNINNYSVNTLIFNSTNNYIDLHFGDSGSLVPSTIISNHSMTFTSDNDTYTLSNYNNEIYSYNIRYISLSNLDLSHTYIYNTNIEGLSLIIDNQIIPEYSSFPPSGYSELSLKDYQGVVFVPKNYNDIQCSVVGDLCNTTFDYYYQEEIKEAYFPLDNRFNIRFNSDFLNSPNEHSELKSTYFPISQVSVNETFYYAFMIYNYTNDGSPLDPETYYAYGDAKVWYDSTKWNYYLVDDFNTWSANVCYMLDGNEVCTTISGLPTLKDAIEQAQLEDNILGTHVGDLNLFSSIIRFPLGFVQSLTSESCTAIQLPPLPFIGGNISLPCMSLIYQQVLGIYQPVISGFINFIIIYYLILAVIKFYNRTFDPSKAEIEVIDL